MRRATGLSRHYQGRRPISIHALRAEGDDSHSCSKVSIRQISIHALRAEGDPLVGVLFPGKFVISIHALRAEGDGAPAGKICDLQHYFYPRPPCGGRRKSTTYSPPAFYFYPRPPCGGRPDRSAAKLKQMKFLSTPSVRRATSSQKKGENIMQISIHALRAEGDRKFQTHPEHTKQFLSTPSVRRATGCTFWHTNDIIFLSTPSVRRATL